MNKNIQKQEMASLAAMPNIETLALFGAGVTNNFMNNYPRLFPSVLTLNIGIKGINDEGLATILPNHHFQKLILPAVF